MIKTLIIEDEAPAAQRLEKLLLEIDPQIIVLEKIDGVKEAVQWFSNNEHPDLVMLDIQLSDGLSFDIFKSVKIESFVIFTTAYDEYAIKAFELNSLDYLLKPIDRTKLSNSLEKFKKFKTSIPAIKIEDLLRSITNKSIAFKKRFAINIGARIKSIETREIAAFSSIEKSTFLHTYDGHSYPVDFSLDKLESLLNPEEFYRINRQAIIQYSSIEKINILSKSRIRVNITGSADDFLVSTAKAHSFRLWLDK